MKAGANGLRRWLAIDERPAWIARVQTAPGRALLALAALLLLVPHFGPWESGLAVFGAMLASLRPAWRGPILFGCTWLGALLAILLGWNDTTERVAAALAQQQVDGSPTALAVGLLFAALLAMSAVLARVGRAPQSLLARRPVLTLLAGETLLCGLASLGGFDGWVQALLWSVLFVLTPYLWFLPYAVVDQRGREPSPRLLQLATLRPFWSSGYLPFGKGATFLRKHLAKTPEELAVTQLKALKLLLWANLLFALRWLLGWIFLAQVGLPEVAQALDAHLAGQPLSLGQGWLALVLSTVRFALQVAIWAHLFIGIARLAGYRLPRGSWRPLESHTLMDYFNRFHYYFKELLVDFFFVPTFFKLFRGRPRLRMFFATFMAAGVGNALWHFFRDVDLLMTQGPAAALQTYTSYLFYCGVLATGVGLSQVRANLGRRPADTPVGRVYSFVFVWSFVVILHVFSDGSRNHTLGERLSFLASLFGVN